MTDVADKIVDERKHDYSEEELEHAKKLELPVMIARVDCVDHADFCRKQRIMAYPTLRLFVDGERWRGGDYRGHRTVVDFADYLKQIEGKELSIISKLLTAVARIAGYSRVFSLSPCE